MEGGNTQSELVEEVATAKAGIAGGVTYILVTLSCMIFPRYALF